MMSLSIQDITTYLASIAPPAYQAPYDNIGLLVGNESAELKGVFITLDVTEQIVMEAVSKGCNLIVAHHPPIFKPMKRLVYTDTTARPILKAITHKVALYAIHTNLDYVSHGVNKALAARIGLQNTRMLAPLPHLDTSANTGAGMMGTLSAPQTASSFLDHLKQSLNLPCIRYTPYDKSIQRVAICGGAGFLLLPSAVAQKADAFVTADVKYHQFFDAQQQLLLADVGHYESEAPTKELLRKLLSEKFPNIAALYTSTSTNPIVYHV